MTFDPFAASLGIAFVPVDRESKNAYHDDWPNVQFSSEFFKPTDNIGGIWGERSGGIVDIDNDAHAACRAARRVFTSGPSWGRAGKRDSHFLVRSPGAKTRKFKNPFTGDMIVEIRSTGSQSVLPPSVHPSGERYTWERQGEPEMIDPVRLESMVGEVATAALIATFWTGSRHDFALRLAGYFVKRGMKEDRATRIMQLVIDAAEDEEPADRLRAVTDTYRQFAEGEDISADFSGVLKDDAKTFIKTLDAWLDIKQRRFRLHSEQTLLARPAAAFLVSGILVQGSLIALVAEPNVGKTFLANDLALHIAAGERSWLGRALHVAGPVLYVIGEGLGRFKYRVIAWKQTHKVSGVLPFHWIDEPVPLTDESAASAFIKEVSPLRPALVVLDTLSRCLMGANENSQEDMGKAIAVCDELRARTGAAVLMLHHTKKDGSVERGSTVLRGAADTLLMLKEEPRGVLTLTCEKQKDADAFEPITLVRRSIQLDDVIEPETGEPVSSCVIRIASDDDLRQGDVQRRNRVVDFVAKHPGVTKNDIAKGLGGRKADLVQEIDKLASARILKFEKGDRNHVRVFVGEGEAPRWRNCEPFP
jgi:hypothetical protein